MAKISANVCWQWEIDSCFLSNLTRNDFVQFFSFILNGFKGPGGDVSTAWDYAGLLSWTSTVQRWRVGQNAATIEPFDL